MNIFSTQQVLPEINDKNSGYLINTILTAGIEVKVEKLVYCTGKLRIKAFIESVKK